MSSKSDFIQLLETIEKDKGIPREEILRLIEGAVVAALHKHLAREVPVQCSMDAQTGEIKAMLTKRVVPKVRDPIAEVTLADAQKAGHEAAMDAEVLMPVDTTDFSRIAAQTAKQVILQKLREVEKENLFRDFKKQEALTVVGSVYRYGPDKMVFVSLGKIEAILRKEDQIPGERFPVGQTIKALVRAVEPSPKGPQVYLSRSTADFIKCLLRLEVPEVHDGTVEVLGVAREPGFRSKVLVRSSNPSVDPVGACVGIKGTRIRPVIEELHGEKIDLVPSSDKVEVLLTAALAPAKVASIEIENLEKKTARVKVDADQISGAIGKDGVNLKLAMQLTGWKLTVTSPPESPAVPAPVAETVAVPAAPEEKSNG